MRSVNGTVALTKMELYTNQNKMKRLFQHYEGEIKEIEGLILKGLRSLIDDESIKENVILFWMQTEKNWLRIFFTNLLKLILNPTVFNKLINKKRGITPLYNIIFLNQVL